MTTTHIGKYELVRRLGGGGMAEVFLAKAIGVEGFARPVAIKRVLPHYSADRNFAQMFINEARISALLRHANIVSVTDFDRDADGSLFLVMELVDGKDLDALEQTGPLPWAVIIYALGEVLRGLGAAHDAVDERGKARGIVHRDVSPHNVLLSWDGAVKVSDFGIAKAVQATGVQKSGMIKGKPSYMSPEQARALQLDGRADIFSAGVMLHQLLTGYPLFRGDTMEVVLSQVLDFGNDRLQLPWPHQLRPEVPQDLSEVTMTMLARDARSRYAHALDAMAALKRCRDASVDGQDQLVRILAERFQGEAPARHASVGAPATAPNGGIAAPPRPSMGSAADQQTWIVSAPSFASRGSSGASASHGSPATPPAYTSATAPSSLPGRTRGARWPIAIGAAVAVGGIAIAIGASRGSSGVAPGAPSGVADPRAEAPSPAATVTPDAPAALAPPDAQAATPVDAALPVDAAPPVDAGPRPHGRGGGSRGSGAAGSGSRSGSDTHIQVLKIGGGP